MTADPYRPPPGTVASRETVRATRRRVLDIAFAAVLFLFVGAFSALVSAGTFGAAHTGNPLSGTAAVLASFGMPVALVWRRSHPTASAVAVYLAALLHFVLGADLVVADVLVLVALYSVTAYGSVLAGRLALGGAITGALIQGALSFGPSATLGSAAFVTILISAVSLLAWALGLLRRTRVAHTETLVERARRLEVERDQQAQIATAAERSRIAREMHDVVAHSLSVVIAQADGGRYAAATDPQAAERALSTIGETGRAALADMRKILGVLRAPDAPEAAHASTLPQPVDADLDALVTQVRATGLPCSLVQVGLPRTLPPGTGLTIYRICQEALTNVLKHGGPSASATVVLQWAPQQVSVQIEDTGRGAAAATGDGAGHGILGMRERVELFAGTLEAGPRPGGGFRVRAVIPLPRSAAPGPPDAGAPLAPATWPLPPPRPAPPDHQEGPR